MEFLTHLSHTHTYISSSFSMSLPQLVEQNHVSSSYSEQNSLVFSLQQLHHILSKSRPLLLLFSSDNLSNGLLNKHLNSCLFCLHYPLLSKLVKDPKLVHALPSVVSIILRINFKANAMPSTALLFLARLLLGLLPSHSLTAHSTLMIGVQELVTGHGLLLPFSWPYHVLLPLLSNLFPQICTESYSYNTLSLCSMGSYFKRTFLTIHQKYSFHLHFFIALNPTYHLFISPLFFVFSSTK